MKTILIVGAIAFALICASCQTTPSDVTNSDAAHALSTYLQALVAKDEATLTLLSCADWEASALMELDSFQSVETSLEDLNCQQNGTDDESAVVVCAGKILTSYGDETQEYELSDRTYKMVKQGTEWLVCGY
jgi:hypothetical protein